MSSPRTELDDTFKSSIISLETVDQQQTDTSVAEDRNGGFQVRINTRFLSIIV